MSLTLEEIVEDLRQHPKLIIADDYEIGVERIQSGVREFRNGELRRDATEETLWVSLRVIHRKQPGRAITTACHREALGELVESSFSSALSASVDPWFRFPIWRSPKGMESTRGASVRSYDSLFTSLEGPGFFDESYEIDEVETLLHRKTERFQLRHHRQIHGLRFGLVQDAGGSAIQVREHRISGKPLEDRGQWLAQCARFATALAHGMPFAEAGTARVLMGPAVVTALLKQMAPWFHADLVQSGKSPLPTERPAVLFAEPLTLIDGGNHPGAPHAAPFDLEGSATQETVLVDRGEWRDCLYDTYAATRENRLSTGNFLKGAGLYPRIRSSNLFFAPSSKRVAELAHETGDGYCLLSLEDLRPVPGTAHGIRFHGSGWRVAAGECTEPLTGITVECDLPGLFRRAAGVANDLAFHGSCGSPSILFDDVPLVIEGERLE